MSPPPAKPAEEELNDDYESDEYDEEEGVNNSGAEDGDDYQDEDGADDGDVDDEEGPRKGKSLTEQLLLDNNADGLHDEDDEDDGAFVPGGGVEPAEEEVDGDKHELSPQGAEEVASLVKPQIPGVSAIGIKRKTSGDEEDAEDDAADETEAKRAKAGADE